MAPYPSDLFRRDKRRERWWLAGGRHPEPGVVVARGRVRGLRKGARVGRRKRRKEGWWRQRDKHSAPGWDPARGGRIGGSAVGSGGGGGRRGERMRKRCNTHLAPGVVGRMESGRREEGEVLADWRKAPGAG